MSANIAPTLILCIVGSADEQAANHPAAFLVHTVSQTDPFAPRLGVPGSAALQSCYRSVCLALSKVIASPFLCPLSSPLPMLALM